jgi:PAS domain-containing protein
MHQLARAGEPAKGSTWSLFDFVGSGIAVTSPDGTIEYCNTALLRFLGQDSPALEGSSIFALLDGGDWARICMTVSVRS